MAFWNKVEPGIYRFSFGTGDEKREFSAIRNEAGFAGRQWDVWAASETDLQVKIVDDQLATRDACAHEAYRYWDDQVRQPGLRAARASA